METIWYKGEYITIGDCYFDGGINADILALLNKKQDKLIAGVNIKTINNKSILGLGNLSITANLTKDLIEQVLTGDIKSHNHKTELDNALKNYVRKDGNKVLSTNDYTTAEKDILNKLNSELVPNLKTLIDINTIAIERADKLDTDIKVIGVNVGNLINGAELKKDQSIESILRKMLQKKIDVIAINPSVYIDNSGTVAGTYEVGTFIEPNLTHTYIDGEFKGETSEYPLQLTALCTEGVTTYYRGEVALTNNTETYQLKEETISYKCDTDYENSTAVITDNLGNISNIKIDAGKAISESINFTGKRYGYYGGLIELEFDINSVNIKSLSNKSFDKFDTINLPAGMKQVVVAFPDSWGSIIKITDDNGLNADITDAYIPYPNVTVQGANNEIGVSYKVYIMKSNISLKEINHTILIN